MKEEMFLHYICSPSEEDTPPKSGYSSYPTSVFGGCTRFHSPSQSQYVHGIRSQFLRPPLLPIFSGKAGVDLGRIGKSSLGRLLVPFAESISVMGTKITKNSPVDASLT